MYAGRQTCMSICMCACLYMYVCRYIHMYIHINEWMYACLCVYIQVNMHQNVCIYQSNSVTTIEFYYFCYFIISRFLEFHIHGNLECMCINIINVFVFFSCYTLVCADGSIQQNAGSCALMILYFLAGVGTRGDVNKLTCSDELMRWDVLGAYIVLDLLEDTSMVSLASFIKVKAALTSSHSKTINNNQEVKVGSSILSKTLPSPQVPNSPASKTIRCPTLANAPFPALPSPFSATLRCNHPQWLPFTT